MNLKLLASLSLLIALACGRAVLLADDAKSADDKAPTTQKSEPVNTKCPIGGEKIDPKVTYEYNGKIIGFCCKDCIPDFKKDPEKYMKDLK